MRSSYWGKIGFSIESDLVDLNRVMTGEMQLGESQPKYRLNYLA